TPDNTMWLSGSGTMSNHWIRFDLQAAHALAAVRVWNHNHTGYTIRGIDECYIEVSSDGSNWSTLSGPETDGRFSFAEAPGASDYIDADLIDMSGVRARYVRFRVWTGHNAGTPDELYYAGLSEVRFYEAWTPKGTLITIH
ncbi:MAG: discoidin domain-containing protein, partial [Phycisphaerae bacterium]|nr:discoidin domain-containing protein [Phycisphaerae bacterium]